MAYIFLTYFDYNTALIFQCKEIIMKKIVFGFLGSAVLSMQMFAASIMGFEFSPEIGLLAGQTKLSYGDAKQDITNYGAFGRIWLGAFDFVVAPQIKYDYNKKTSTTDSFTNFQYGISAGYNIGLIVARLTPYVGVNYSSFNRLFKDTISYNAGLKLKIDFIPVSLGVLYTYQNPEFEIGNVKAKMHTIQALIGLHF